jgi:hypothetical protein
MAAEIAASRSLIPRMGRQSSLSLQEHRKRDLLAEEHLADS